MSGGFFEYYNYSINDFIDMIERELEPHKRARELKEPMLFKDENDEKEYEYIIQEKWSGWTPYSQHTIDMIENCLPIIEKAGEYLHAIDWLFSGDSSEQTFSKKISAINNSK